MKNNYKTLAATLALLAGVAVALPAFALDNTNGTVPRVQKQGWGQGGGPRGQMMGNRGVFGTVASINGNALTVTGKVGPNGGTPTTYTIDTTNAKVTKSNVASTVSAIAVGDTVMVQGTVSGTNIAATIIRDLPAQAGGIPNAASMMSGQNREKEDDKK